MKLHNLLDIQNLNKMIEQKYISVRFNASRTLRILNYSHACQFDGVWNDETEQCRGLIVDNDDNVIARPFRKFRNYEEDSPKGKIPNESFEAFEKMDGSLGVMYMDVDGEYSLATRGSFDSDQAIEGTKILRSLYGNKLKYARGLFENKTVLFEIIYPENRIVVDYKGLRDVVMLTIIDNETGKDVSVDFEYPWRTAQRYDGVKDLLQIKALNSDNQEGFVILFESGYRCKVKFEEYMRLHRVITGVNDKDIWESLSLGKDPEKEYADKVPDEFYAWLKQTKKRLVQEYAAINATIENYKLNLASNNFQTRKEIALYIQSTVAPEYRGFLFSHLDGKDYSSGIWKMIRPVGPFSSFKADDE